MIVSSNANKHIRAFILASQDVYCTGFADRLSEIDSLECALSYDNADGFIAAFEKFDAHVLLFHRGIIEHWAGIRTVAQLIQPFVDVNPDIRIIIFDCEDDKESIRSLIRAGAHGVHTNKESITDVANSIQKVAKGYLAIPAVFTDSFIREAVFIEDDMRGKIISQSIDFRELLTSREIDVFEMLMDGATTKEIATDLKVSEQSIKLHLGRLYKKFNVTNRTQLVISALTYINPIKDLLTLFQECLSAVNNKNE